MASLALVHYATSTGSESSLMELMNKIVDISPGYTGEDGSFVPPISWTTTDQAAVKRVKELLMMSLPLDSKGSTAPVIHVGMHNYSIYTTAKTLNKWCYRLCASIGNKKAAPLLAPSWDYKSKKLRFTLMLPGLARHVLSEWSTMYAQLQVAVDDLPMAAVTGPSPTKSELKKMNIDLVAENDALTALNADLAAENDDLQSAVDRKVCTSYHASYIGTRSSKFFLGFPRIFCLF